MSNKRIKEFKNLTQEELAVRIRETEKSLFQAKMSHKTGQLEDTARLWRERKDLARLRMLFGNLNRQAVQSAKSAQ